MANRQAIIESYNSLRQYSRSTLLPTCQKLYNDLKNALDRALGSMGGYFTAIRIACAFMASDGQLSFDEYQLFKEISSSSCNYEELYQTVAEVSNDFRGAIEEATGNGYDVAVASYSFALAFCALKGNLSEGDLTLLSYFPD